MKVARIKKWQNCQFVSLRSWSEVPLFLFYLNLSLFAGFYNLIICSNWHFNWPNSLDLNKLSLLKFGHSEKALKIWNNLPLSLTLPSKVKKKVEDCFKFMWPSQKIWTVSDLKGHITWLRPGLTIMSAYFIFIFYLDTCRELCNYKDVEN